ncbi:MAG: carboxypeptidase-like regulatory domain-containing protein [Ignavibacteria bacterium]|nr:carboxypeptidase-like regulatory domain-containing protein [Ignavibacteria bacterium]
MKASLLWIAFFLVLAAAAHAQTQTVTGVVCDARTRQPLQFATVRILERGAGTTTDRNGSFMLRLPRGRCTVQASYIGYASLKQPVDVGDTPLSLTLALDQGRVELPGITVTPADNPAFEIIRQAIAGREKRRERLDNYSLTAHTKLVVTIFNPDASAKHADTTTVTNASGAKTTTVRQRSRIDSAFSVIMETQTDAYWAKPDRRKEIVKARKQSALLPKEVNVLVSSFFIGDFSEDRLDMGDRSPITGPISLAGLRAYDYTLRGSSAVDGEPVHVIDIAPRSDIDPLLAGTLYIAEGTFALAMVDVSLNDAALPPFLRNMRFRQHFQLVDREFWLPSDVILDAGIEISFLVDLKIAIEGMTVLQDYAVNRDTNETVFDRTAIKVLKEADRRDSLYWEQHQKIPNTAEEVADYRLADSLKISMDSVKNRYSISDVFIGKTFEAGDARYTVPGIFGVYRFNRVEGSALYLPFHAARAAPWLADIGAAAGYGFSDRRWKYRVETTVEPFGASDFSVSASLFDMQQHITDGRDLFDAGATTLSNLLYKFDEKDYFRAKGATASIFADLFRFFPTTLSVGSTSYFSVKKNTDWSLFRREDLYRDNPAVNDGHIDDVSLRTTFDGRDFIDNAGTIQRIGERNHVPDVTLGRMFCDLDGARFTTDMLSVSISGHVDFGLYGRTTYRSSWSTAYGMLPTQRVFLLPGSVDGITNPWRFRTLHIREFGGDRIATLFAQHDFGELFRRFHVPLLQNSGIAVVIFGNGGWTSMRDDTRTLQTVPVLTTPRPFYEAGFGFDRVLLFLRFDFAWRMNYFRDGRNFFFGISSAMNF